MRMKDVIISVTGVQQGVNGPDAMELVTAGQYGQDEKETLLTWQESELTGMEGTKTSLCVQPRSVVLSREGTLNTRMEFEEGRKRYFLYETPFGSATMGLNTRRIVNRLGAHGGEIEIDYSVDMDDTITSLFQSTAQNQHSCSTGSVKEYKCRWKQFKGNTKNQTGKQCPKKSSQQCSEKAFSTSEYPSNKPEKDIIHQKIR